MWKSKQKNILIHNSQKKIIILIQTFFSKFLKINLTNIVKYEYLEFIELFDIIKKKIINIIKTIFNNKISNQLEIFNEVLKIAFLILFKTLI